MSKTYIHVSLPYLSSALDQIVIAIEKDMTSKIKDLIIKSILEGGKEEQKEWIDNIKKALSDKLPVQYLHKRRPDRDRMFPYLVTGQLQRSVKANLSLEKLTASSATFKWWFGLVSPHATYTTKGFKSKDKPKWIGWADRVFKSSDDNNIPSAQYLITMFFASALSQRLKGL